MTIVWKTTLGPGLGTYELPEGARVLALAMQRDLPCIWYVCDSNAALVKWQFLLIGTGQELPEGKWDPVGSFLTRDENFVFHVFAGASAEIKPATQASPHFIDVVFDGPPEHAPHFIDVQDVQGRIIKVGEWLRRDNGCWALRIPQPPVSD